MFSRINAALEAFEALHATSPWLAEAQLAARLLAIETGNAIELRRRARARTLVGVAAPGVWS